MKNILIAALAAASLSACATLDGVGARIAASDVSIVDAAIFVHRVRGLEFDPGNFSDRVVLYRAVDTVARLRRGDITEDEAAEEVDALLRSVEADG